MRPDPSTMSDAHLLDEYLIVYRDAGRRRQAIRAELESRLSSAIIDAEVDGKLIARLKAELDAARAEVERAKRALLAAGYTDHGGQDWKPPIGPSASRLLDDPYNVVKENEQLRARVGELERDVDLTRDDLKFLDDVRKENVQLRVDLRKAMELLCVNAEVQMWVFRADADVKAVANWVRARDALLTKYMDR